MSLTGVEKFLKRSGEAVISEMENYLSISKGKKS